MRSPEELLAPLETFGTRLGLDATRRLLSELGSPERRLTVVLVAGTNGKGSTSALLAAMATAAGYRTGLYTSPHLESLEERVRIDGRAVDRALLAEGVARTLAAADGGAPTWFEALTVAAIDHFAASGVELAVLEVGLGGRLDATNACEPALSLITDIGLEHRDYLGPTLRAIAREKAGVLRRGRPAAMWTTEGEARTALRRQAAALGAELVDARGACRLVLHEETAAGQRLELRTPAERYRLELPLAGEHQLGNLAVAVVGAELLRERGWDRLDRAAVAAGVRGCRWPGRLERVALPGGEVLLDGAHNPAAARALSRALAGLERPCHLIFGALRDKEVESMLPPLAELAERVVLTVPATPRALSPEELRRHLPGRRPSLAPSAAAALDLVLGEAPGRGVAAPADRGVLTVVCGSLYLVGEVRALLTRRFGLPTPAPRLAAYEDPGAPTPGG